MYQVLLFGRRHVLRQQQHRHTNGNIQLHVDFMVALIWNCFSHHFHRYKTVRDAGRLAGHGYREIADNRAIARQRNGISGLWHVRIARHGVSVLAGARAVHRQYLAKIWLDAGVCHFVGDCARRYERQTDDRTQHYSDW